MNDTTLPAPSILYKYVTSQAHHIAVLPDLRIRFTQPDDLNDPYDCIPGIDVPPDISRFVDAVLVRSGGIALAPSSLAAARAKTIAQYEADPDALVTKCFEIVRKNLNKIGVLSLASRNDNLVMWSHYAESHRGFVIGLRTDCDPLTKRAGDVGGEGELRAMKYVTDRLVLPADKVDLPPDTLFRKDTLWSYEGEWRVVRRLTQCDHYIVRAPAATDIHLCSIEPQAIVRIDIGEHASAATITALRVATGKGTALEHVELYQARMNAGRTAFKFIPLYR